MRPRSLKVVTRVRDYWPYNGRKLRASQNRVAKRVLSETSILFFPSRPPYHHFTCSIYKSF
jgi:hypothetical protein